MHSAVSTLVSFVFVGALWGCTNPFIKLGSNDHIMYTRKDNSIGEYVNQLVGLVKNWQFVLPFLLNQSGSVAYVYLLSSTDISNAVPICNSLTFVFTAITSRLLGEKLQRPASDNEEDDNMNDTIDVTPDKQPKSVTTDPHVDKLWGDMNASTTVSKTAVDRTAKLLGGLTAKTKHSSRRMKKGNKKRKAHDFIMPILSVDVERSRKDMAEVATSKLKVDRVIKFAGKEYSVAATAAKPAKKEKGLDKVLDALVEPKKVSTIEKSSLDWDKFKEKEGIEEELTQYTKDGYDFYGCSKQQFLQRLDLKRFEIEKAERDKQRKLQQQQPK
ncbi:hypothetical protein DD238_004722 [Peronospora effusa]|uniref:BCNT-C domain-containing protein n=1 Tax=Peronospora effusa TaxID=542832 RepID=A0A3M6VSN2_9STRA|nr:hypothetical protein DD238_004722 [Peronospora effusa]